MQDSTSSASGITSMKLPVIVEAALANICSITGLVFFFFEKENLYVRAHALQSVLFFLISAIIGFPFFLLCVCVGGALEGIYIALLVIYFLLRIALIVLACVFAKNETFFSIPFIKELILKLAN
ncbi:hypothetical protein EDI_244940 [Entamoeba dispar SAW760]|uniref:Uncharacterized protein n=1 Tax=Entamoeba dispar (strain ATCC PRA-260 / SAW760) TaxID=370354 RepID=B0EGL1_ENTDS|nr:uncharacterized protein EDI_244940 [Entamoeba dispar SAW760]EDR26343.1 hypothetical protein EDI_244940 [Entamoeba dispar SAW760]|eukprot:EDR26343.1 hypothetical protein EDI_244940 [Entamoeba dispar SAW760]